MSPRESAAQKALRLIDEGRIRLVNDDSTSIRHVYSVLGDSTDAFAPEPYRVVREFTEGRIYESCGCANPKATCSHLAAARLIDKIIGL